MSPYSYLQKKFIGFQLGYRRLIIAIALLALPAFQKKFRTSQANRAGNVLAHL
jgi:hypothetical protein